MDVLILLDKLDDLIYSSKPIPLTDQVRVEREEVYSLLDQIRVTLPEEIKQARWIVKERQEEHEEQEQPDDGRLRAIADSIEELKRSQRPAPPPLTAAAAEKVRSIIEAAEESATQVRAEADREARRIEGDAARRGMEMRKRSAAEAAARLRRADEVTAALLAEAGSASADIEALLDRVRGPAAALADVLGDGATTVQDDFDRMRERMADAPADGVPETPKAPDRAEDEAAGRREGVTRPEAQDGVDRGGEAGQDHARDYVSQATEEWSYEESVDGEGQLREDRIHASLPGAGNEVTAERLTEDDEAPDVEPEPESADARPQSRRFERPGPHHLRS